MAGMLLYVIVFSWTMDIAIQLSATVTSFRMAVECSSTLQVDYAYYGTNLIAVRSSTRIC